MPPGNYDFSVRTSVGECNENGTRTATFTIEGYTGEAIDVELDFDTTVASTDYTATLPAGSPSTNVTTHDYASGATYNWEARFLSNATGVLMDTKTGTLVIDGCCDIQLTAEVGDCNPDGTREVVVVIENDGTLDTDVEVDYDDGSVPSTYTISAGATKILTHDYASGTYTITVTPDDCDPVTLEITVDPCDTCPVVSTVTTIGDCDDDGNREVSFTLTVTPSSATQTVSAVATIGSDTQSGSSTGSNLVLTATDTFSGGATANYSYEVTAPLECDTGAVSGTVDVPECDDGNVCPNIDIDFIEKDCDDDGNRKVKVKAIITGSGLQPIEAELSVDGTVVDSGTGLGSVNLADTDTYAGGDNISASVDIITPSGCDGYSKSFTVSDCDEPDDSSTQTPDDDDDDEEDNSSSICWILGLIWAILVLVTLLCTATMGFWTPWPVNLIIGIVLGIIDTLYTAFYIAFCGICDWVKWTYIGVALFVLVALVIVVLSLLGLVVLAVVFPGLVAALIAAGSMALVAMFFSLAFGCGLP